MIHDNSTVYTLQYLAQPANEYSNYLPTIQKMIDSFSIIDLTEFS
jgi:hypothetical protein